MSPLHDPLASSSAAQSRRRSSPPRKSQLLHARPRDLHYPPLHRLSSSNSSPVLSSSARSSEESVLWSEPPSDSELPLTPTTDAQSIDLASEPHVEVDLTKTDSSHASTTLVTEDPQVVNNVGRDRPSGTQLIQKYCCGGGCCYLNAAPPVPAAQYFTPIDIPDNDAFRSLNLKLGNVTPDLELTNITPYPDPKLAFEQLPRTHTAQSTSDYQSRPPRFVQPHPPYETFSAPVFHARELTKPGAEKRTFHFDIDVTDYPEEGDVDFKVGGAVGICPPNSQDDVNEIFSLLGVPSYLRDKPVKLNTQGGRWPTMWGEEQPRSLITTRRELLTWCADIQSYPPTKAILRCLAEYANDPNEKKILLYLSSAQGQPSFCDLRTGPHLLMTQLLHAFPSSRPPLEDFLGVLQQLMPRFYSLSNDPHVSSDREGLAGRQLIEVAVTVHEKPTWRGGVRTGVGSGYLERIALEIIEAEKEYQADPTAKPMPDFKVPMFRGLMANPLSREFGISNGPMMLIGAGVGMAPFRGFILNRLRNANCASKIWLVQGIRDSSVDELYSGELGKYEHEIKKVVQSRAHLKAKQRTRLDSGAGRNFSAPDLKTLRQSDSDKDAKRAAAAKEAEDILPSHSESRYVQDEVRQQADVVWDVINAVDGRVFVCGSSKGMGEGVEDALRDVVRDKGKMDGEKAREFWDGMKRDGKFVMEVW